jgi:hypothetical protein
METIRLALAASVLAAAIGTNTIAQTHLQNTPGNVPLLAGPPATYPSALMRLKPEHRWPMQLVPARHQADSP